MHYQVVLNKEDLVVFKNTPIQTAVTTEVEHFLLTTEDESLYYRVVGNQIVVIREIVCEDVFIYDEGRAFNPHVLPFLASVAAYLNKLKLVKLGDTVHTVNVWVPEDIATAKFFVTKEYSKPLFHEKEGVVFTREGNYYQAVSPEVFADMYIRNMNHSLRFFDDKYLVRFERDNGEFIYYPVGDVYSHPVIREIKNRVSHPRTGWFTHTHDWDNKKVEIHTWVDTFTSGGWT